MLGSKVALITGAARGIGLATTRLLLKNGARVSMVDVAEKLGRAACAELQREFSSDDIVYIQSDVTKTDQLRSAFQDTKDRFGGIDIVCNNAGMTDENKWREMVQLNLVSVIEGTYLAVEYMSTNNGGRGGTVVNVASFGGLVAMGYAPVYCATKHGVVSFSRSLKGLVLSDDVRVNSVSPEFVNTRMVEEIKPIIGSMELLSPEAVAEGILQLITDKSLVGATMTITSKRGIGFWPFADERSAKPSKSKL